MSKAYKTTVLIMVALMLAGLTIHAQAGKTACTWPNSWDTVNSTSSGLRMPVGGTHCGDLGDFPEHECCCWCNESQGKKWCRYGQVEDSDGELRGAKWSDLCAGKVMVPGSPRYEGFDEL
mmetsp:Transcript_3877/g.9680  ORF Transcript_3877/g.9680 Transcript_3877/m.9680 type:complete len:120 (-) Transcript_3877:503-862(-)|eukprot:CAMPEP_0202869012 /NCGR_PEP_ID=MMETSP1391-20130828/11592_1 /ASSEMBLY_ACC=CAM_ASM_000867 /TAXON_ID=1034604 /ORGANISM="Chlamydomonas leiostraca, Strain SAG 11-49" /LENGTH=119 /DNA_ID=CAMNT_0049549251 /DNA_START=192 /DNA_END=551 /DNA_ORIENTATION=-